MEKNDYLRFKYWMKFGFYISLIQTIMLSTAIAGTGNAQVKKLDEVHIAISLDNSTLKDSFTAIEQTTDYKFAYDEKLLKKGATISFTDQNISVKEVLLEISKQANVSFQRVNNKIDVKTIKKTNISPVVEIFDAVEISGAITDESGQPLPGANILEKGTFNGTLSDLDGKFTLSVTDDNAVLVISYVGYGTQEVSIKNKTFISVTLIEDASQLETVVVTALGIKKEQRALGYATSTVKATEITKTATPNFATALYGKATGVQIASTSGGSTSAVNITIRGVNSITGRSQPLIIMDGVPFRDNEVNNNNYWSDQRIRGNGLLDLNPDDIESITILKGASAAALYGSEAVNGVVLVTTKKGEGKLTVNISASYSVDKVAYLPKFQNVRGAGSPLNVSDGGQDEEGFIYYDTDDDGVDDTRGILGYSINFGPKFDGKPTMAWDGVIRPYEAQQDGYSAMFQDALNSKINVSVGSGDADRNLRFSYTRQDNQGVSRGAQEAKNILNLKTSFKTGKRIKTDITLNYINQNVKNRPYSIDRMINNFSGMLGRFDHGDWYQANYKTSLGYRFVTGTNQSFTPDENLIYNGRKDAILDYFWRVNEQNLEEKSDRFIGIITNTLDIAEGLTLRARLSTDLTKLSAEGETSTTKPLIYGPSGSFSMSNNNHNLVYGEAILTYTRDLTPDLNLTVMGGYNASQYTASTLSRNTQGGLSVENWFDMAASTNTASAGSSRNSLTKDALLGTISFDYKAILYLEGTIRRDRTSTMHPDQNAFSYPSVNSSFIFTDAFALPDWINFGKIRGSWGIVGNYPDAYRANVAYTQKTLGSQGVSTPIYTSIPGSFGNDNIRPEEKHEYEFGIETRLFKNKIGFDFAYYNAQVVDQILPLTLPVSSGATSILTNIGTLRNSGIEMRIDATPIETQNFSYNVVLNVAKNQNKVEKLAPGLEEIRHANYDGNAAELKSVVGESMGDFYTHPVATNAQGRRIVDPNGMYKVDADTLVKVGNAMPKAIGGFLNHFQYKNISLDVNVDFRYGGHVMPTGLNWMTSRGLTEESTQFMDNESGGLSYYNNGTYNVETTIGAASGPNGETVYHDGMLLDGVQLDDSENNHVVSQAEYYWTVYNWGGPQYSPNTRYELYIKENHYIKMREISLGYSFPKQILDKIGVESASLSVFGRNLFYIYRNIKNMDAEATTAGARWNKNVNSTAANPSSRTFGLMLRVGL